MKNRTHLGLLLGLMAALSTCGAGSGVWAAVTVTWQTVTLTQQYSGHQLTGTGIAPPQGTTNTVFRVIFTLTSDDGQDVNVNWTLTVGSAVLSGSGLGTFQRDIPGSSIGVGTHTVSLDWNWTDNQGTADPADDTDESDSSTDGSVTVYPAQRVGLLPVDYDYDGDGTLFEAHKSQDTSGGKLNGYMKGGLIVEPVDPQRDDEGTSSTVYTFRVKYREENGLAPQPFFSSDSWADPNGADPQNTNVGPSALSGYKDAQWNRGMAIIIDGVRHWMTIDSNSPNTPDSLSNYVDPAYSAPDGVVFKFTVRPSNGNVPGRGERFDNDYFALSPGYHTYYFQCSTDIVTVETGGTFTYCYDDSSGSWSSLDIDTSLSTPFYTYVRPGLRWGGVTDRGTPNTDSPDVQGRVSPFVTRWHPYTVPLYGFGAIPYNPDGYTFHSRTRGDVVTQWTFWVNYVAHENIAPFRVRVFIDGTQHLMTRSAGNDGTDQASDNDGDYTNGEWYYYTTSLGPGQHYYVFDVDDTVRTAIFPRRPQGEGAYPHNVNEPNNWHRDLRVNNKPELANQSVTPTSGPVGQEFRYRVTYTDADNDIPRDSFVNIITVPYRQLPAGSQPPGTATALTDPNANFAIDSLVGGFVEAFDASGNPLFDPLEDRRTDASRMNLPRITTNNAQTITVDKALQQVGAATNVVYYRVRFRATMTVTTDPSVPSQYRDGNYANGEVYDYFYNQFPGEDTYEYYFRFIDNWGDLIDPESGVFVSLPPGDADGLPSTPITGPTVTNDKAPILSASADPRDNSWDSTLIPNAAAPANEQTTATTFTYRVVYTDADNNPPTYVRVRIGYGDPANPADFRDVKEYNLAKLDPNDNTYTDGVVYQYQTQLAVLPSGLGYKFQYYASDGVKGNRYWDGAHYVPDEYAATIIPPGQPATFTQPLGAGPIVNVNDAPFLMTAAKSTTTAVDTAAGPVTETRIYHSRKFADDVLVRLTLHFTSGGAGGQDYAITANGVDWIEAATGDFVTRGVADGDTFEIRDPNTDALDPDTGGAATNFAYRVRYFDTNNQGPENPGGFLRVHIDGAAQNMSKADASDNTYTDGVVYTFSTTLPSGTHRYHFEASDGDKKVSLLDTGDLDFVGPIVNDPPTLSNPSLSPSSGGQLTSYTYQVTYTDADNDPPDNGWPELWRDEVATVTAVNAATQLQHNRNFIPSSLVGHKLYFLDGPQANQRFTITANDANTITVAAADFTNPDVTGSRFTIVHVMRKVDPADNNFADGVIYTYSTVNPLTAGTRSYHFEARSTVAGLGVFNVRLPVTGEYSGPVVNANIAPVLSSGSVNPTSGIGSDEYVWRVTYTDADNNPPQALPPSVVGTVRLFIDGVGYDMERQDPGDNTYTDGTLYVRKSTDALVQGAILNVDSATTVTVDQALAANAHVGQRLILTSGNAQGRQFVIASNGANTVTISSGDLVAAGVAANDTFRIGIGRMDGGQHNYYFAATDGVDAARLPASGTLPGPTVNFQPTLTDPADPTRENGTVFPATGSVITTFTYRVVYTDGDNQAPTFPGSSTGVQAVIDGTGYDMQKVNPADNTYTDGVEYVYSRKLRAGRHTFSFRTSDGQETTITADQAAPDVAAVSSAPILVDQTVANVTITPGTAFTYRVQYTDADNSAPASLQVHILKGGAEIAGSPFDMAAVAADPDYTDGAVYEYTTNTLAASNAPGDYTYFFTATDTDSDLAKSAREPLAPGTHVGPDVNTPPALTASVTNTTTGGGTSGAESDSFRYAATYTDVDGHAPVGDVTLHIFNSVGAEVHTQAMTQVGGAPASGLNYEVTGIVFGPAGLNQGPDNYTFTVTATDGFANGAATTGPQAGPTVTAGNRPTLSLVGANGFVAPANNAEPTPDGETTTEFVFQVRYTDADGNAPQRSGSSTGVQITITAPGGGQSTFDMTSTTATPDYTAGVVYEYRTTLATPGLYAYTFNAGDGTYTAVPVSEAGQLRVNTAPVLEGVTAPDVELSPTSGAENTVFEYLVVYRDADNHAPSRVQVILSQTDGTPVATVNMAKRDATDNDYTDGAVYRGTYQFNSAGTYQYHFEADDFDQLTYPALTAWARWPASGETTGPVTKANNPPELRNGAVKPSSGSTATLFRYEVTYVDKDNDAPGVSGGVNGVEVIIDGARYAMSKVNASDNTYTDGALYRYETDTLTLTPPDHNYYFEASDGIDTVRLDDSGNPFPGPTVVANTPPVLSKESVTPLVGTPNSTTFVYTVTYTDAENNPPDAIQLQLSDDGGTNYTDYAVTPQVPGDTDYTDGAVYEYRTTLPLGRDYAFRFQARDREAAANPTAPHDAPDVTNPPTLEEVEVKPTSGQIGMNYTFRAKYTDPDNDAPDATSKPAGFIQVVLTDPRGNQTRYDMSSEDGLSDYTAGVYFRRTVRLDQVGVYLFYIQASDGVETVRFPEKDPISIRVDGNVGPTLTLPGVSPEAGTTLARYTFTVTYTDPLDPAQWVRVIIDAGTAGERRENMVVDPRLNDPAQGAVYTFVADRALGNALSEGQHTFHFEASDGTILVREPASGEIDGPFVNHQPKLTNYGVKPFEGGTATLFRYEVVYSDKDGHSPELEGSQTGVQVLIDGTAYDMVPSTGSPNYRAGVLYTYTTTLKAGAYNPPTNGDPNAVPPNPTWEDFVHNFRFRTCDLMAAGGAVKAALVLDRSGSMYGTPIDELKKGAKLFVSMMEPGDETEIIDFDHIVTVTQPFTSDQALLNAAIDSLYARGSTALWDATLQGVNDTAALPGGGVKAVIAMTDGWDNSSTAIPDDIIAAATAAGIPVYMIGFADNPSGVDDYEMRRVANATGGLYMWADPTKPGDLANVFANISTGLRIEGYPVIVTEPVDDPVGGPLVWSKADPAPYPLPPVLEGGKVDPISGTRQDTYTFSITYSDFNNEPPRFARVYIDGNRYDLQPGDPADDDRTDGVVYLYQHRFDKGGVGPHKFYFEFADRTANPNDSRTVRFPETGQLEGPTVYNGPPSLSGGQVSPTSGLLSTTYTYTVTYTDPDNDPPEFVRVYIEDDGQVQAHDMVAVDPSDPSYHNGADYTFTTTLVDPGRGHTFYFHASDGVDTARDPASNTYSGPRVNYPPVLSGQSVNPTAGTEDEAFVFRVNYLDEDNDSPAVVTVFVYSDLEEDVDGDGQLDAGEDVNGNGRLDVADNLIDPDIDTYTGYTMQAEDPSDTDYTSGGAVPGAWFTVTLQDTLSLGPHAFFFTTSDNKESARLPAAGVLPAQFDGPRVAKALTPPVLSNSAGTVGTLDVNPIQGSDEAVYTWSVIYRDPGNEPPAPLAPSTRPVPRITIDGVTYDMRETNPADTLYTDGKVYQLSSDEALQGVGPADDYTIGAVTATTLQDDGSHGATAWPTDFFAGAKLVLRSGLARGLEFPIVGNTADTLTVTGDLLAARVAVGDTYRVSVGRLASSSLGAHDATVSATDGFIASPVTASISNRPVVNANPVVVNADRQARAAGPPPVRGRIDVGGVNVGQRTITDSGASYVPNAYAGGTLVVIRAPNDVQRFVVESHTGQVLTVAPESDGDLTTLAGGEEYLLTAQTVFHTSWRADFPARASQGRDFTWRVWYQDVEGDAPDNNELEVLINGTVQKMTRVRGGAPNYRVGEVFEYTQPLTTALGLQEHLFRARLNVRPYDFHATRLNAAELNVQRALAGPIVTGPGAAPTIEDPDPSSANIMVNPNQGVPTNQIAGETPTTFTFEARYKDADNNPPTWNSANAILVHVLNNNPDFTAAPEDWNGDGSADSPLVMTPVANDPNYLSGNYVAGVRYRVTTQLPSGTYQYYFEATDTDRDGSRTVSGVATPLDGPTVNGKPVLSNPTGAPDPVDEYQEVTYTVTFTDPDNDLPAAGFPQVTIKGLGSTYGPFPMTEVNRADTDTRNGKQYRFKTTDPDPDVRLKAAKSVSEDPLGYTYDLTARDDRVDGAGNPLWNSAAAPLTGNRGPVVKDVTPPAAPTNVAATDTSTRQFNSITVTWDASADDGGGENDVVEYRVYRRTAPTSYKLVHTETTVGQANYAYEDRAVDGGVEYTYSVRAVDRWQESADAKVRVQLIPPGAPQNLQAVDTPNDAGGSITLTWERSADDGAGVNDVLKYRVYRRTRPTADYLQVGTVMADGSSTYTFEDTPLTDGVTYYYVVRATDFGNESADSNEVSAVARKNAAAPPTHLAAADVPNDAGGSLLLTWDPSADDGGGDNNVTEYHLYRSQTAGSGYTLIHTVTTVGQTAYTYTDTGLTNGTTYFYVVRAFDGTQESEDSNEASAAPVDDPPAAPTNVAAADKPNDQGGVITVTWDRSADDGQGAKDVKEYRIYRASSPYTLLTTVTADGRASYSYHDTTAAAGTAFTYKVRAVDNTGESADSNEAGPVQSVDNVAPAPPTDLTAADTPNDQGGSITLAWKRSADDGQGVGDVTGYRVCRKEGDHKGRPYEVIAQVAAGTTSYVDTQVQDGTDYTYLVKATDGTNEADSNEAGPVQSVDNVAPAPPTELTAADTPNDQGGSITLTWKRSVDDGQGAGDVIEYRILRATAAGGPFQPIDTASAGQGSYLDQTVTNGTPYYYQVKAYDGANESAASNKVGPVQAEDNLPPAPPTELTAADTPDDRGGSITLEWKRSADDGQGANDVVEYRILRSTTSGGPFQPVGTAPAGQGTYADQTVTDGTPYYYVVRAYDGTGESANSNQVGPVEAVDNQSLLAPTGLRAMDTPEDNGGSISLTWEPSADDGSRARRVAGYRLYRSTTPGTYTEPLVELPAGTTAYTDSGVKSGTAYYYLIRAFNDATVSADSNEAGPVQAVDNVPPAAPAKAAAADTPGDRGGRITVTWDLSADDPNFLASSGEGRGGASAGDVTGYRIYRSETQGEYEDPPLATVEAGVSRYVDATADNAKTYYYRVSAYDGTQEAGAETEAAQAVDDLKPDAPTEVKAADTDGDNGGSVTVTWTLSAQDAELTEYRIYRTETQGDYGDSPLGTAKPGQTSFVDNTATKGREYWYVVRAFTGANESANSNEVGPVKALDNVAPAAPQNVAAADTPNDQGGSITLTWERSADDGLGANDVTEYRIYRLPSPIGEGPGERSAELVATVAATGAGSYSYQDAVTDGAEYTYRVRAYDGTQESDASNKATATSADNTPPAAPQILSVVDTPGDQGGSITLTWELSADDGQGAGDVAGYRIYRKSGGSYELVGEVAAGTTTFIDTQVQDGTDYTYLVKATDGTNEADSNETEPVQAQDNLPPTVVKVVWVDETHVEVEFSEPVEKASAEEVSHYTIAGLTVKEAVLQADGRTVRLTTSQPTPATSYTVQVEGVTDRGNNGVDPEQNQQAASTGLWHRFPAGLHLMAVPATPADPDPSQVFRGVSGGLKLARWNPEPGRGERYVMYPENPDGFLNITRGLGYWLLLEQETFVVVDSQAPSKAAFNVPVARGWSMIGNPYLEPLAWALDQIQVQQDGVLKGTLAEASTRDLIQPFAWSWNPATQSYELVYDPARWGFADVKSTIDPWAGVWIKVKQPGVSLVFSGDAPTPPRATANRSATPENWSVELGVTAGAARDEGNRFGVLSSEPGDLAIEQPPRAVTGGGLVDWAFVSPVTRSANLAAAFRREPVPDRATWEAVVTTDRPDTDVTIYWTGLDRSLPDGYRLWLVDQETGQRVLMNTRSHYTFRSGREGITQRHFTLEVAPKGEKGVQITRLEAQAARGAGVQVSYTLTAPAQVRLSVSSLSGRTVVELPPVEAPAGLNTATWEGVDADGRRVPAGTYLIKVLASTEEGDVIQAVRTVQIP